MNGSLCGTNTGRLELTTNNMVDIEAISPIDLQYRVTFHHVGETMNIRAEASH
jgi:hypothetical protein